MWLNRYIDVVIVYYHCWILLASRTHIFLLIRNVPNSAIEWPIAILQCSHLKLETTWLSLASWDISALYFSSRACIGETSLHPSRSCKSETNHEHQKVKISRSACQKLILSGLRCVSLSGNWKNKGSSFMFSQEQPIMHHSQRDTNRLKTFKLLGNQWFLQAVFLELSGDRSLGLWSDPAPARSDHSQLLGISGASKGLCTHVRYCMIILQWTINLRSSVTETL